MDHFVEIGVQSGTRRRLARRGLMIAFAVVWTFLTVLVVMQDHAIDAQRTLIRELLNDLHNSLNSTAQLQRAAVRNVSSPAPTKPEVQEPAAASKATVKAPSPKVTQPSKTLKESPSSQVKAEESRKTAGNSRKMPKAIPVGPPAQVTDPSDMRRTMFSI